MQLLIGVVIFLTVAGVIKALVDSINKLDILEARMGTEAYNWTLKQGRKVNGL